MSMDRFGVELAACRGMRIALEGGCCERLNLAEIRPLVDRFDEPQPYPVDVRKDRRVVLAHVDGVGAYR